MPVHALQTPRRHNRYEVTAGHPNADEKIAPGYNIVEKGRNVAYPQAPTHTSFRAVSVIVAVVLLIASCELSLILLFALRR
ncbi:hypothetical protein E3P99_03380 [Wallemia hederae]|uniref:Uncharacterized protein n=1 Tax=Wallemia hederae TaxID=1540922 RepID=A0A4T0FFQ4_9BASI|nr:hypothetical protein E3P99_03380 [Wallemia hederae]